MIQTQQPTAADDVAGHGRRAPKAVVEVDEGDDVSGHRFIVRSNDTRDEGSNG